MAEGLLFPGSDSMVCRPLGTEEEMRARILDRRHDLIAQTLIQGMVDITEEHMAANYHYWSTRQGRTSAGSCLR